MWNDINLITFCQTAKLVQCMSLFIITCSPTVFWNSGVTVYTQNIQYIRLYSFQKVSLSRLFVFLCLLILRQYGGWWPREEKRGKITAVPFLALWTNWLFIKFRSHLSIQRMVSKLLCWPQITSNRLSLSRNKAIIYLAHISSWGERKRDTIRLLFVPLIDVTHTNLWLLPQIKYKSIKHLNMCLLVFRWTWR